LVQKIFLGINVPGLAHGKMYKRVTFEHLALPSELVSGLKIASKNIFKGQKQVVMKKDEKIVRKHFVKMRMNDDELNRLQKLQQKTTEKNASNYLRKVVLQKPVMVKYRNQSADDFLKDMLELKKELNAIGNNFNQAVKKLHILDKIPEFRAWILTNQSLQQSLVSKIEEIKCRMNQLYEQWLRK
jgi:hypothetical protein